LFDFLQYISILVLSFFIRNNDLQWSGRCL